MRGSSPRMTPERVTQSDRNWPNEPERMQASGDLCRGAAAFREAFRATTVVRRLGRLRDVMQDQQSARGQGTIA
jgi:hypothetical protein